MPTKRSTTLYDVNDFKVVSMTDDNASAPTYGAELVDVPGIAEVSLEPNIESNELKGDAKVMAKRGTIDRFNFSATYGRLALDAQAVMLGGVVEDVTAETGGAESVKWSMTGTNSLPYFKALFQILQAEVGAVNVIAWKSQVTGGTLMSQSTDEFGQPEIEFESIPCTSDENLYVDIEFLTEAAPLTLS